MKFDKKCLLLYAVTDRTWVGRQTLLEQVEDALKGGVTFVQLREKDLSETDFTEEAVEMKKLWIAFTGLCMLLLVACKDEVDGPIILIHSFDVALVDKLGND